MRIIDRGAETATEAVPPVLADGADGADGAAGADRDGARRDRFTTTRPRHALSPLRNTGRHHRAPCPPSGAGTARPPHRSTTGPPLVTPPAADTVRAPGSRPARNSALITSGTELIVPLPAPLPGTRRTPKNNKRQFHSRI